MKLFALFFLLSLSQAEESYTQAEEAETIEEAQEAFNASLSLYLEAEKLGSHPFLSYNIGNTYFHLGEPAWALYHYEQAHKLAPRNREIAVHRKLAREQLHLPLETSFRFLSTGEQNLLLFLLGALACGLTFFRPRLALIPGVPALLVGAFLLYAAFFAAPSALVMDHAMVRRDGGEHYAPVRSHPLLPGTKVVVKGLSKEGDWIKVRTPGGDLGYIRGDRVRLL